MLTNYMEFECLFYTNDSVVDRTPEYEESIICIDLLKVIAFNPYREREYTVVRMMDRNSYIIKVEYEEFKVLVSEFVAKMSN